MLLSNKEKEATKLAKESVEYLNKLILKQTKSRLESLQTNFQRVLDRFRSIQSAIQLRMIDAQNIANNDAARISHDNFSQSQEQLLIAQQTNELSIALEEEAEMRRLEQDILELDSLHQKMSQIVHQQAQLVDDIESNIEQGYEQVMAGNEQLHTAVRHRQSRRKKCCICWIILVTVFIIIVIFLLVKYVPSKKSVSQPIYA